MYKYESFEVKKVKTKKNAFLVVIQNRIQYRKIAIFSILILAVV